jgi:hypothetical protein
MCVVRVCSQKGRCIVFPFRLGFRPNRYRPFNQSNSLTHTDKTEPPAVHCGFRIKTRTCIANREMNAAGCPDNCTWNLSDLLCFRPLRKAS